MIQGPSEKLYLSRAAALTEQITHKHMHTLLLTVHRAPLWLRGGRCCVATGHSEVGGQGVWRTQGHPPHVFGPELLSPWRSSAEVLIVILEERRWKKRRVERSRGVWKRGSWYHITSHSVWVTVLASVMCVSVRHLLHSPVCANGQQTVVFTLKSCSGLEKREERRKSTDSYWIQSTNLTLNES